MDSWKYVDNMIEVVTRGSFKLMDILLRDHVARLIKQLVKTPGDADYLEMHGSAGPELSTWASNYLAYRLARGVYKGRTQAFYDALGTLPDKLDDWDIDIQAAGGATKPYKAGKPAYTILFPQGRTPFTKGALEQRLAAVEALAGALAAEGAPLATVATAVSAFHTDLLTKRSQQQQEEGGTEVNSDNMEARRVAAATVMYQNVGRLMAKLGPSTLIEKFFDMSYIRDGAPPPPEGAPPAPLDFFVGAVGGAETDVLGTWGSLPDVLGYRLYRRLPGEVAWTMVGETDQAQLQVTGQPQGVELEFAVTAFNDEGEGPRSAPDTVTLAT